MEIFPHADVTRLEDVGHYVMEENPDRVISNSCQNSCRPESTAAEQNRKCKRS